MLKSLDVLIGLAVIMLVLSMIVTVLTQFITGVLNSRGRHLKNGLADLLKQLDPELEKIAGKVAARVLTHPLIRENSLPFLRRAGSVIQREEFTKLLLELGAGEGPHKWTGEDVENLQKKLSAALERNGLSDPARTLDNVRMLALNLESSNPELANNVRQSIALLHEASGPFIAKVNAWFDQTMDRTSQRFTFSTRGISFACAALVAIGLQVDTIGLVNRLAADERLRAQLGQMAGRVADTADTSRALSDLVADPSFPKLSAEERRKVIRAKSAEAAKLSDAEIDAMIASADMRRQGEPAGLNLLPSAQEELKVLADARLVTLPDPAHWRTTLAGKNRFGMLITVFLLALGGPFWYDVLKRLINLRSVLAQKEDRQREERQTQQASPLPASALTGAAAVPALSGGERGDLGAVG